MDEDTTTNVATEEQAVAEPQPEPVEQTEAVTETTETTTEEQPSEQATEPSDDDQLKTWAESKGLQLDSDNATKAAKMAREAERAMHQKAQRASELEKASKISDEQLPADITPEQRDTVRMRNLELKFDIQQWKSENSEKLELESEMVQVLSDPTKRALVQEGYLSLDDVYNIAKGNNPNNEAAIKSQGKQEALRSLAQKQQAAVPTGQATTSGVSSSKITPQNVDELVGKNSVQWFEKNREAINAAMR